MVQVFQCRDLAVFCVPGLVTLLQHLAVLFVAEGSLPGDQCPLLLCDRCPEMQDLVSLMTLLCLEEQTGLTYLCLVDSPILLNWINLFPKLGMSSIFIYILRIFLTEIYFKQTVHTQMRHCIMRRLIWVYVEMAMCKQHKTRTACE